MLQCMLRTLPLPHLSQIGLQHLLSRKNFPVYSQLVINLLYSRSNVTLQVKVACGPVTGLDMKQVQNSETLLEAFYSELVAQKLVTGPKKGFLPTLNLTIVFTQPVVSFSPTFQLLLADPAHRKLQNQCCQKHLSAIYCNYFYLSTDQLLPTD